MKLVTGGAGFIGSHIVRRLLDSGERVRVFDNFSSGTCENLHEIWNDIEVVEGDLRNEAAVRSAVRGADTIFHLGAVPSVPRSIADPATTLDVNVRGTLNLLTAARDAGCRRLVFSSSSSVYGNAKVHQKSEAITPNPLSPYAISKLSGEQLCSVFTNIYGIETVALRYFNVFGPRQDPDSPYSAVIPAFIKALSTGSAPTVFGDGEQTRDFTYVDNVVQANLSAATADRASGQVFNVASGRGISLNHLLNELRRLTHSTQSAIFADPRSGDVRDSLADISRARDVLGYSVAVPFEQGLEQTVRSTSVLSLSH